MLFLIAGVAFAILGVLAYIIMQMPDSPIKKRKKEKKGPPPEPPKDWQAVAERLERKFHAVEAKLKEAEGALRDKDKEIGEHKAAIGGIEREFKQEQLWRKKEEEAVEKEKKHEKLLEAELAKERNSLTSESTQRIKLEYEVKELRTLKESATADARRLSSLNMELERQVKSLTDENRDFKRQNAELKVKKEAHQWVAKDDFITTEKLLKRARWEVDLFKRKFAADLWPRELQMRPKPAPKEESAAVPEERPPQPPSAVVSDTGLSQASEAGAGPALENAPPSDVGKDVPTEPNPNTQS